MKRPDGITTGLADEDDFAELARVVREAFGASNPKADEAVLRWQYDAPFGPTTVAVLRDRDRIVGQWAAIPYRAVVEGRPGLVARTADAAILPSHRGRGLWPLLARTLFDVCAGAGMPIAFSYPNDQSVAGLRQVGWTSLGTMTAHVLVTSEEFVAERLHLPRSLVRAGRRALFRVPGSTDVATSATGIPEGVDDLWAAVADGVRHAVVRDAAWLQWRYLDRPGKEYRFWEVRRGRDLAGVAVAAPRTIGRGRFGDLLELLALDDDAAAALVRAVHDELGDEVDGLACGALEGSELSRRLLTSGFRLLPDRLADQRLRAGAVDTSGDRPALLRAQWHLGWGDMDHL